MKNNGQFAAPCISFIYHLEFVIVEYIKIDGVTSDEHSISIKDFDYEYTTMYVPAIRGERAGGAKLCYLHFSCKKLILFTIEKNCPVDQGNALKPKLALFFLACQF